MHHENTKRRNHEKEQGHFRFVSSPVRFFVIWFVTVSPAVASDAVLLHGSAPDAIVDEHFPTRMHAFVWRNWESVEPERMAAVLQTTPKNVVDLALSMGLPPHAGISEHKHRRGYVSLIRRNWHLLNYDQLMQLLDWDADKLAHVLKEEDFLWFKLGMLKPKCEPLKYEAPDDAARRHAERIAKVVHKYFPPNVFDTPAEPRFAFISELSAPDPSLKLPKRSENEPLRFLYSYFALYGDPLSDPTLDPYPEGLLQRLAARGVTGVWLHVILRELAPSKHFPEFGEGHEKRLENLRQLVQRAKRYGIDVILYTNEPRSMPDAFYEKYPDIAGHRDVIQGHTAMCTSTPVVRAFMRESLEYVFKQVPDLGGIFNITMVENLTNCYSRAHGKPPLCPRCSKRTPAEVIAESNTALAEGVHAGDPDAKVLIWDWVWKDDWIEPIVTNMPSYVYLMSVSEWDLPINRGGVETTSGEYSLSAVGPGERALRNWSIARKHGMRTIAKIALNTTWELSVVPYLPVMDLAAEHLENLHGVDIDGLMLSWTLGGYPSINLELLRYYDGDTVPMRETVLRELAVKRFGLEAAPQCREAWQLFSDAFREYPFHITQLYNSPVQLGPANLLYPTPTGYQATMVGMAYDDLTHWRAVYPADVLAGQFEKLATGWQAGTKAMLAAMELAKRDQDRQHVLEDYRLAEAAYCHFQSVANQTRFTVARDEILAGDSAADLRQVIRNAAESEIDLAVKLFHLTRFDSRIGFEATNHYMYYPLDLVEKVVNCRYILDEWLPARN